MDGPRLTEPGFGDYMLTRLKSCHENRVKVYSFALNAGLIGKNALCVSIFRLSPLQIPKKKWKKLDHRR